MIGALGAAIRSFVFATTRVRVWLALLLAHLALALPAVLTFARTVREASNHRADPTEFASELQYTAWFEMRDKLSAVDAPFLAAVLGSFLLGIFAAGGWLEVIARQDPRPSLRAFTAGGGARFFRFLRLAFFSLAMIAAAQWLFYGPPADAARRLLGGGNGPEDFATETAAARFTHARSLAFAFCVGLIVLWSDLARASLALRGGRSVVVAIFEALWLLLRRPLAVAMAVVLPCGLELAMLFGVGWLAELLSEGAAGPWNLSALFLVTQLAVLTRELTLASRLGALYSVAEADAEARLERRYGDAGRNPLLAAAGGAMADEEIR